LGLKHFIVLYQVLVVYGGIAAELGPRTAASGRFEGVARPQHFSEWIPTP
jgi:hypothetical protein